MTYTDQEPLVEAMNLKKYFSVPRMGMLHAVDDVSFKIYPGETLGMVGESGCGKSTVGNVVVRIHEKTGGKLLYRGKDVFTEWPDQLDLCKRMQLIFQDPYSSLNPRKTIESILSEAFKIHKFGSAAKIADAVREVCDIVEFPHNLLNRYPHELDGGRRQVVGIARALSLNADFIVCDEPVSSLDVSVQARIINLLMRLQQKLGLSYLFISHDLSVVRHISKRIVIMYLGQIVETADTDDIFSNALHPYSIALLSAIPRVNTDSKISRIILKGDVPSPMNPKPGCRFAPRCWMAREDCATTDQEQIEVEPGHFVFCKYAAESREEAKVAQTASLD
jgi:oligopeptide/dipeptide ABC transporter ATP-binding protein